MRSELVVPTANNYYNKKEDVEMKRMIKNDSGIQLSVTCDSSISPSKHGLSGLKGFNS